MASVREQSTISNRNKPLKEKEFMARRINTQCTTNQPNTLQYVTGSSLFAPRLLSCLFWDCRFNTLPSTAVRQTILSH
jgi:hypothetical protein